MPCEAISPCLMTQIQTVCQICGKNMKSGHATKESKINYQKQVDPPVSLYISQLIPDRGFEDKENAEKKSKKVAAFQICIPCSGLMGLAAPSEKKNEEKKEKKEADSPGILNSAAMKVNRLLLFLLATCMPMGGGGNPCPPPVKMMLCLPCPPPEGAGHAVSSLPPGCGKSKKPKDYTYRCESRELRGGNLYTCCQCNKRNGLQHDCPRTPCQGRPACLTKPWPDCWPSGGCHGIDFSRETGVKRYDPCSEQRFDKKECRPPNMRSPKSECGGNMMVLVCPPPQPHGRC